MTIPSFTIGCSGHRNIERLGDIAALRATITQTLDRLVTAGDVPLFTGLADGVDRMMIEFWQERSLGPIVGIVPYEVEGRPAAGNTSVSIIPKELLSSCNEVISLTKESHDAISDDTLDPHRALALALLERVSLLIAVSDGENRGPGGVEDTVALARARKILVRYIPVTRADGVGGSTRLG